MTIINLQVIFLSYVKQLFLTFNYATHSSDCKLSHIDNIFTHHFDMSLQSSEGILVTDITYHYPVLNIKRQITTMVS